jgi:RNA polymerase sigma-70 factor (ECF subfamily)
MDEGNAFLELIKGVRAGNQQAAAELVQRYEPAVRRAVRLQLRDARLRRALDSMDVCQSVLASFFVRAASGQYDLDRPNQLVQLLVIMARNKLASQARHSYVARRERPSPNTEEALAGTVTPGPSPSQHAAWRDLLREVRSRLSAEEQELADRRGNRQEWAAIAAELGGNPDALRKKLDRALDRVSRELGLDELNHG